MADFTISATGLIICLLFTKLRSELLLCTGPFTCCSQEFQICAVMLSNTELWTRLHIYWLVAPLHVCRFTEMLKQNFAFRLEIKTFKCLLVSDVTTSGHESLFALFMSELIHGRDVWLDNDRIQHRWVFVKQKHNAEWRCASCDIACFLQQARWLHWGSMNLTDVSTG